MTEQAEGGAAGARQATVARSDFNRLYAEQWWPMLRLAAGLLDEAGVAEDVVQDAFTAVYRRWDAVRDRDALIGYLRTSVVNAARSALRRKITARKHLRLLAEEHVDAADRSSMLGAEHEIVRKALDALPDRQREVLTMRYIGDLGDADIAVATGLSVTGVRSAASRGLATLRSTVGGQL